MTHYPTKPGFYYRNGRWYPSKKTKQKRAREKLIKEISEQIHLFPEKYPYEKFALSQAAAKQLGFEVWWQKCKKGHLVERRVTESGCPVCARISRVIVEYAWSSLSVWALDHFRTPTRRDCEGERTWCLQRSTPHDRWKKDTTTFTMWAQYSRDGKTNESFNKYCSTLQNELYLTSNKEYRYGIH